MIRIITLALALCLSQSAFAEDANQDDRESDKLRLDKLEQKYWAPKDKEFKVVQNRTYSKEGRFSTSLMYGMLTNDTFTEGALTGFSGAYYFSEYWGIELSHIKGDISGVDDIQRVELLGAAPDYSALDSSTSLSAVWVPFYAKMSVMDNTIIYFDMAFGLGVGQTAYDIQTKQIGEVRKKASHITLDVTQHYYLSKHFAFRFDLKYQMYKQERLRQFLNSGEPESARKLPTTNFQNMMLLLGATYFF